MEEFKENIRTYYIYVSEQKEQHIGRGNGVEALTTFLFDAYLNVPEEELKRYIEVYPDRNDEGTPIDDDRLALNKYEVIQHRQTTANKGEDRMMALVA
jgi:hypothetical protein